ncbi:hypothetical protein HYV86_00150 [Candidatus Woesearchaeota archaeon]|nr:hypothetical protein [Candidatus Woesearchaeota archaeon]
MDLNSNEKRVVVEQALGTAPYGETHYRVAADILDFFRTDRMRLTSLTNSINDALPYLSHSLGRDFDPKSTDPQKRGYNVTLNAESDGRVVFYNVGNLVAELSVPGSFFNREATLDCVVNRTQNGIFYVDFAMNRYYTQRDVNLVPMGFMRQNWKLE